MDIGSDREREMDIFYLESMNLRFARKYLSSALTVAIRQGSRVKQLFE